MLTTTAKSYFYYMSTHGNFYSGELFAVQKLKL